MNTRLVTIRWTFALSVLHAFGSYGLRSGLCGPIGNRRMRCSTPLVWMRGEFSLFAEEYGLLRRLEEQFRRKRVLFTQSVSLVHTFGEGLFKDTARLATRSGNDVLSLVESLLTNCKKFVGLPPTEILRL